MKTPTKTSTLKAVAAIAAVACVGGTVAFAINGRSESRIAAEQGIDEPPPVTPETRKKQPPTGQIGSASDPPEDDEFDKAYAEWLRSDHVKILMKDLSSLPRKEIMTSSPYGYATLEESADHADLAVAGTVEAVEFIPYATITQFRISRAAKEP